MKSRLFAIGLVVLSAALAACGGGGGGGGTPALPTPSASSGPTAPPIPQGSSYTQSATMSVPQPTPAPGGKSAGQLVFTLPAVAAQGAISGSVSVPGQYAVVGTGEHLSITLTNQAPQGVRPLSKTVTPIAYIGLQFTPNIVALETPPSFSLTLPAADILPSTSYWIAAYDPTQAALGWQMGFEGPHFGASSITFSGGGLFDFAAGGATTYWFALYAASSALPAPTPAPTAAPQSFGCTNQPFDVTRRRESVGPRPLASGDSFSYGGANSALTQTISRVAPCPMPTSTALASVTDAVTISATSAPGNANAFDMHSVEDDAFATNTVASTTDSIVAESAASEVLYSTKVGDAIGNTTTTTYSSPQTLVELPETQGNTWSLDPAGTMNEALVDGTAIARTVNPDGTYTENETTATGYRATITIGDTSGAGTYEIPGLAAIAYGAPSGGSIQITLTPYQGKPQTETIPAWFSSPVTLYSDTSSDQGVVASLPSWCTPSVTVTTVHQIAQSVSVTDPVLGYTEQRFVSSFDDQTYGTVCMQISDTVDEYYDYQLDTPYLIFVSGNGRPNQTNTLSETYVMNATPTINSIARRAAQDRINAIDSIRSIERAQRASLLSESVRRMLRTGGVR